MMTDKRRGLRRFAWLSVATALLTIALKVSAYLLTGSVGLLSDALESGVNLVAAVVALIVLTIAAQPPDEEHAYGHTKAEYFASGVEGTLIIFAAFTIAYSAIIRLIDPQPLDRVGIGLLVSIIAGALNFVVARILLRAGQQYRSITLVADARHLLTDVWTTVGVLVGVTIVALSGWFILDPIIALLVAIQIVYSGLKILRESVDGFMDRALPADDLINIKTILDRYTGEGVYYHALRTRRSGAQRFMSVHVQVPGTWTVQEGHSLLEDLEKDVRRELSPITIFTHLEPLEDPRSWEDISIYRTEEDSGFQ